MKNLLTIYFIFYVISVFSQNLIPNGSFEQTTNLINTDPDNAFQYLDFWYKANYYPVDTSYGGSPDLFDVNNPFPSSQPANFWNMYPDAREGVFFAGIANHVKYTGNYEPEAIGTILTETLEKDEFYVIETTVRNKGTMAYLDNIPTYCVVDEDKRLDILLYSDSIFVTIDAQNNESFHNASKSIGLRDLLMDSQIPRGWTTVGTCFQADGTEQFLGITTTTGRFEVEAPCVIYDEHWNAFYIYYYDIDDIKLTKLPEEYRIEHTICVSRENKINIAELVDLPVMQNPIEFYWEDGTQDTVNYIFETGTYQIDAILDCKTIPIYLEVNAKKCVPDFLIPNAFSPNNDGFNDKLETFIVTDMEILEYEFMIFNRFGTLMYSTNDINAQWDGTYNGQELENGVFPWILKCTVNDIEEGMVDYQDAGDVTIIR